jgi:2,4-dichlorophenol 6-monooxygenase
VPEPVRTEVVVVGGGPVGLTVAGLLARQGVQVVLVERRQETISAPAAHVLRNGPREILSLLGVDEEIERAVPAMPLDFIVWCATLAGRELGRLDLRASHPSRGVTPAKRPWTNLSQSRLEPILRRAVAALPAATVVTGSTCTGVSQTAVNATVHTIDEAGVARDIEADWVIAADGAGSRIRKALNVELEGSGPLGQFLMIHFSADLSTWIDMRPAPIFWISNPRATGTLIVHDVLSSHVFMTPMTGEDDELSTIPKRLSDALGLEIPIQILSVDTWTPFSQVASRYRDGRVLLIGDAAHRFPPSGGLGMNTGIWEAHNLAWKLAMIQSGLADSGLIDSYDAECRPAARLNAEQSLANALRLGLVDDAIGRFGSLDELERRLDGMTDAEETELARAIEQQRSHFAWNGTKPLNSAGETARRHASPYGEFTLFAPIGGVWREVSDRLAMDSLPAIRSMSLSTPGLRRASGLPAAFVTRPDGVIVWSIDEVDVALSGLDIASSIRDGLKEVLMPPPVLDEQPSSQPLERTVA